MTPKPENLIVVLDAGSQKSCVLVAEVADGVLRYRGHGVEPSQGMRKGLIGELGPAAEAINRAALTAERTARATIETAVVGIGGSHVRGINPGSSGVPIIVYDFPLPVCPYAKMHVWYPSKLWSRNSSPRALYTSDWCA